MRENAFPPRPYAVIRNPLVKDVPSNGAEALTQPTGVGAGARPIPALKERIRALVESWTELQSSSWNAMAALAQYEEVERIGAAAEQAGARDLAEPAVELAVYLCTFVEGRLYPTNAQRQKLNEMVERLGAAAEGGRAAERGRERAGAAQQVRSVVFLRGREHELAGLAAQLGQHRYVVRPAETVEQALSLADEAAPDALLVDSDVLNQLDEVIERVDKARGESKGRSVCLVIGTAIDASRRHYAQRAGADAVLESGDPTVIATRLDELIAQQRNLNYRVLIVEDDRSQALYCESMLKHRGIATHVCLSPEGVLEAMAQFKPDLVLLDLYLPGMNGIEVAQLIRERPEYTFLPIVFLSGETDLDKRFDAIRMGGDDFLTKPAKPRHLIVEVETRIRRARLLPTREAAPRGERRGALVSRQVLLEELARLSGSADGEAAALVLVAAAGYEALRDRLGFVAAGTLSQQLAAALAGESELIKPVSASGEYMYLTLARAENETVLKQHLEQLLGRLRERRWLGTEEALKLEFVIAAVRVGAPHENGDDLWHQLRRMAREAMAHEESRLIYDRGRVPASSSEDPLTRVARTLLRGHLIPEAIQLEYQALVPLSGELSGQYAVRFALVPPKVRQRMQLPGERMRELARDMGVMAATDRQCVRRALAELAERSRRGDALRLFLPITLESALDPAFAPWLVAEMQSRALAPASVALELAAAEMLRDPARMATAIESLQLVGARLCIGGLEGGDAHVKLARLPAFQVLKLNAPTAAETLGAWGAERGRLVVEAGKHGKLVVATNARDARELAELLKLGVHYIQADVFAPWTSEPNFDFAGAKL
jgi:DNA-binding response OmpR family regulator/EAL domain-containing protein (putative c-di-GMP-specific phosphodiesterase class I)